MLLRVCFPTKAQVRSHSQFPKSTCTPSLALAGRAGSNPEATIADILWVVDRPSRLPVSFFRCCDSVLRLSSLLSLHDPIARVHTRPVVGRLSFRVLCWGVAIRTLGRRAYRPVGPAKGDLGRRIAGGISNDPDGQHDSSLAALLTVCRE